MVMNAGDQAQAMAKLPAATLPVPEPIPKASAAIRPGEVVGAGSAGQGKVEVPLLQRRVRLRTTICSNTNRSKVAGEGVCGWSG